MALVIGAPGPHAVNPAPITSAAAPPPAPAHLSADATGAMTAVVTSAAMTAAAMTAAMTANKLYVRPSYAFTFLVEDVEGRQADIGNFFLTESDLIAISVAWSE